MNFFSIILISIFMLLALSVLKSMFSILKKKMKIKFLGSYYENLDKIEYIALFVGCILSLLILILSIIFYLYLENVVMIVNSANTILVFIIICLFNLFIKFKLKSKKVDITKRFSIIYF